MADSKRTIALDFDGVLHSYARGYTGSKPLDPPVEGAQDFVRKLLAARYNVVIFSHRAVDPEGVQHITDWLDQHNFPEISQVTGIKPAAHVYVDDRAHRFMGDFDDTYRFIESDESLPWYEGEEF